MHGLRVRSGAGHDGRTTHGRVGRSSVARAAAIALVAATGSFVAAVPATAGPPIENEHFVDAYDSHIEQEFHEDFCPEVEFQVLWEGRVSANFQIKTRGVDGPEYYAERVVTGNRFTNTENGKYLETRIVFRAADQKLSLDGDILTVTWTEIVKTRITSSEDGYVGQESGRMTGHLVIDLNDLEDEEDDVVLVDEVEDLTGHSDMGGAGEFCSDLVTYLS